MSDTTYSSISSLLVSCSILIFLIVVVVAAAKLGTDVAKSEAVQGLAKDLITSQVQKGGGQLSDSSDFNLQGGGKGLTELFKLLNIKPRLA